VTLMKITIDSSVLEAASNDEGAFARAFREEMDAALEDSWYRLLRWARGQHYGAATPTFEAEIRAEAKRRASSGQIPPWGSDD
jgi:hypothetical protein